MENITISIDKELKNQVEHICNELGIDINTAITVFLMAVVKQNGIPFTISL